MTENHEPIGLLAERVRPDGRRTLSLRKEEREHFQKMERVNKAVELFLDISQSHSWTEIAQEVGVSVRTLQEITKTPEFNQAFNERYAELGRDPRVNASRMAVTDMLPLAVRQLQRLISNEDTADTVKLNAIKEVFKINQLDKQRGEDEDRKDLAQFLKEAGGNINIENLTINALPPELQKASEVLEPAQKAFDEDVIDVNAKEVSSEEPSVS